MKILRYKKLYQGNLVEIEKELLDRFDGFKKEILKRLDDKANSREKMLEDMLFDSKVSKTKAYEDRIKLLNSEKECKDLVIDQLNTELEATKKDLETTKKELEDIKKKYENKYVVERLPEDKSKGNQKIRTKASRVKTESARRELKKIEKVRE